MLSSWPNDNATASPRQSPNLARHFGTIEGVNGATQARFFNHLLEPGNSLPLYLVLEIQMEFWFDQNFREESGGVEDVPQKDFHVTNS